MLGVQLPGGLKVGEGKVGKGGTEMLAGPGPWVEQILWHGVVAGETTRRRWQVLAAGRAGHLEGGVLEEAWT